MRAWATHTCWGAIARVYAYAKRAKEERVSRYTIYTLGCHLNKCLISLAFSPTTTILLYLGLAPPSFFFRFIPFYFLPLLCALFYFILLFFLSLSLYLRILCLRYIYYDVYICIYARVLVDSGSFARAKKKAHHALGRNIAESKEDQRDLRG